MVKKISVSTLCFVFLIVSSLTVYASTGTTIKAGASRVEAGQNLAVSGTAPSNSWVSVKALDDDGSIAYFSSVFADAAGTWSDSITVPNINPGILKIIAGAGTEVARVDVEIYRKSDENNPGSSTGGSTGGSGGSTGGGIVTDKPTYSAISYNAKDWAAAGENDYVVAYNSTKGLVIPTSIYDANQKKILYKTSETGTVVGKYNMVGFDDVDVSLWSAPFIWFDSARGVVGGMGDGKFYPEDKVTRAQFLKMLAEMVSEIDFTAYSNNHFKDVTHGAWYEKYVLWADASGIVKGYGNGNFGPNNRITHEQMCVMMDAYAKYLGCKFADTNGNAKFADNDKISLWAVDSVKALHASGFITGKPDNYFDPQGFSTRGESAAITSKFFRSMIQTNNSLSIPWE